MNNVDHNTISLLKRVRIELETLQELEPSSIIKIGAGLEEVAGVLPEEYGAARELLMLCLGSLQSLFEGKLANVEETLDALKMSLLAIDQAIVSIPNPITDAVIKHSKNNLEKILNPSETSSENYSGESEENPLESEETFQTEELETTITVDLVSIVKNALPTIDETIAEKPTLQTLEESAIFLIQLDAEDKAGITHLRDSLKRFSGETSSPEAKKKLTKAAREATKILNDKAEDPDAVLIGIGSLLESLLAEKEETQPEEIEEQILEKVEIVEKEEATERVETVESEMPFADDEETVKNPTDFEPDILAEDADKNLLMEFVVESQENIEAAESALLSLETVPDDLENINTVFRAFHTVKGSAAFLGLQRLTEFAHFAESLLSRMRDGQIQCTGGYANLALRSIDMLKEMFAFLQQALEGGAMRLPKGYGELFRILEDPEVAGINGNTDNFAKIEVFEEAESEEKEETENETGLRLVENVGEPKKTGGENAAKTQQTAETFVRVRTDRLDRLINMVGELVVAQSMLAQDETLLQGGHFELVRKVAHGGKIVRDLQDLSMAMRMVPLKNTFSKMARVVRDVAQKCGKSVEFITEGDDTEIDRNMVDLIADPLVHMVRNAVDHGIELPDKRDENGKSRMGKVRLSAYHAGGNVVVELEDDGKGLDAEKILQKAIEKGLIESDKGMSEGQIFKLIFAPGMSTADKLTDVSGRGVGMDVVRRNIESIHGRIEISSKKGQGSLFTIRLPLTLAITDGMLVRVGKERYIVPTVHIHSSFAPNQSAISTVAGKGEMVELRGELMPIVRLQRLFSVSNATEVLTEGILMIVADGNRRCALLVDELLGQHQVVAKPLGTGIGKIQGVAGGAILGDGCVGLILDTAELISLARQRTGPADRKETLFQKAA